MKPWWIRLSLYGFTQWKSLLAIVSLMCCGIFFSLLKPWPLKWIVDHLLQNEPWPDALAGYAIVNGPKSTLLIALAAATFIVFIGNWAATTIQNYIKAGAGNRMVNALGAGLFQHIQNLSLRFHGRQRTGDLVNRITSDCNCVRQLMFHVFLPALTSLATLASMLVVLWKLDAPLALVALLVTPLLACCIWFFARPMTRRTHHQYELQGAVMAHAEQTLTALPLIRAFDREQHEHKRFADLWSRGDAAYRSVVSSELQFKVSTSTVTAAGTAIVMAIGGTHVLNGTLSVGGLLVFLSYLVSLYSPLETLAYLSTGYAAAAAGSKRVFEIMDASLDITENPGARPITPSPNTGGATLRFEQISFGYTPGQPVLHDVSLEARPGDIIALVGPTGAGKTTLISLIPRFYDPWQGRITLNGDDLRELKLADVRNQFALVLQDPFILPLSAADNIAYGRPGATRTEIIAAATAANAAEFIDKLPDGYDTLIGERGETLSGGQRQRLAIARALVKDAPILLLDEPTAALDPRTESSILEALHRLMRNRTTFIIAHRLSTIQRATRILVLDQGRIVESGTHPELLAARGLYHRLHHLQFQEGGS